MCGNSFSSKSLRLVKLLPNYSDPYFEAFLKVLKKQTGFGLIQVMLATVALSGLAIVGSQILQNQFKGHRNVELRSTRGEIARNYNDLLLDPNNRNATISAPANSAIANYIATGAPETPVDPSTIDPTNINPATRLPVNILPAALYVQATLGSTLTVPTNGLFLLDNGKTCPALGNPANSCNPADAMWEVRLGWIPLAGNKVELQIVVHQINRRESDVQLQALTSRTIKTTGFFAIDSGNNIVNMNGGDVRLTNNLNVDGNAQTSGNQRIVGVLNVDGQVNADNGIRIANTTAACNAANAGLLRYNTGSNTMEYCNGTSYISAFGGLGTEDTFFQSGIGTPDSGSVTINKVGTAAESYVIITAVAGRTGMDSGGCEGPVGLSISTGAGNISVTSEDFWNGNTSATTNIARHAPGSGSITYTATSIGPPASGVCNTGSATLLFVNAREVQN